jgi:hypothetical protein
VKFLKFEGGKARDVKKTKEIKKKLKVIERTKSLS